MAITAENDVRVGDIGTVLRFTIRDEDGGEPIDLTAASVKTLRIQKPDRTIVEKDLVIGDGGADGEASYTIIDGDLDQIGPYRLQTFVTTPAGSWASTIDQLSVHRNLPVPAA